MYCYFILPISIKKIACNIIIVKKKKIARYSEGIPVASFVTASKREIVIGKVEGDGVAHVGNQLSCLGTNAAPFISISCSCHRYPRVSRGL